MSTVNLRDRLFNDTGGVVQGATAQALLVTGGGTDAGTSSVVQATTTTDVNGVWKFTNLPDPGAGNWYDVKIINGNQVRWRYGNIQSLLNALQMTNTSYQIQALGIGTAAPGTTGQLQTTGNVGIGTAPDTTASLKVTNSILVPQPNGSAIFAIDAAQTGLTIANAATAALFGAQNVFGGQLVLHNVTDGNCASFLIGSGTTVLVSQTGSSFSSTAHAASKVSVYLGGSPTQLIAENQTGGSIELRYLPLRTRNLD